MVMERWRQFRTNFGRVHAGFLESRSELIMGDLQNEALPAPTALASRDALYNTPLPFSRENFPSGIDYGRFRAGSRLGSQGEERGNLGWFPNELWARFKACYGSKNRADSARFRRQKHR